ncbi:cellulase family glycosylhydrolase [Aeoliella mucimassa]|uniref:Sugar-binding cellulase-like protein n=1 Tax=Aeoliella mucimassa TaxID=2527972 RepID=A0A518ASQ6_9BACT|nr:cellulase family glycosylhydrolase [Aeoliella mucimassa]QDU57760.1 Sugar-binding cellulase-like protein [Aeoliella mucimassa]
MSRMVSLLSCCAALVALVGSFGGSSVSAAEQWSAEKANEWYDELPWMVGCNYAPATAINQLEMWQADTFDPETIDIELGWASDIGFNTVRVFLHDVAWKEDPDGFFKRVDKFLEIADRHGIRSMVVIFDGVWDPDSQAGPQRRPRPGVHNSGWLQSPGRYILSNDERQDALEPYVKAVVKRYANDKRVLIWDLFNEPCNTNASSYGPLELPNKDERAERLVRKTFAWAREVGPSQPLTVGFWQGGPWDDSEKLNLTHTAAAELSDVITFHDYGDEDSLRGRIDALKTYGRPIMCTEYMARGNGSTFRMALPIMKSENVGAYNWGLVAGKTQTNYPWQTWQMPIMGEPKPWHHEVFYSDGKPYSQEEVELIKQLTERGK